MQQIYVSKEKPMVSAYPPRPQAEPRSGRYAGCRCAAGEVFGCIPHDAPEKLCFGGKPHEVRPKGLQGAARGAYRESDSFAMWAVHHGVTVSMTTVSISSDPFISF